jgi:hypothetical protein
MTTDGVVDMGDARRQLRGELTGEVKRLLRENDGVVAEDLFYDELSAEFPQAEIDRKIRQLLAEGAVERYDDRLRYTRRSHLSTLGQTSTRT